MNKILKENQVANPNRTQIELSDAVKEVDEMLKVDPNNADLWRQRGLALAKMRLLREAMEADSRAISLNPFCGVYYRHRGHMYLGCWKFEEACADFVLASRLIPADRDVWYHLGLSYFLLGSYEKAADAYKCCCELSETDEKLISVTNWYWITLMRLGRKKEASKLLQPIVDGMEYNDNFAYYQLLRMYQGKISPEELLSECKANNDIDIITQGFGLASYYYLLGDMEKANQMIEKIITAGDAEWWCAFGYLAAMVDKKNRELQFKSLVKK